MPSISTYSASKGALERWAEALSQEIGPFGIGVSIMVTGSFATDVLTEQTPDYGNHAGPYALLYKTLREAGAAVVKAASPPALFAHTLAKVLEETAPFSRHAAGKDARLMLIGAKLMSDAFFHKLIGKAMKLPAFGSLRGQAPEGIDKLREVAGHD
jgi:short-subunit dehydrogenase